MTMTTQTVGDTTQAQDYILKTPARKSGSFEPGRIADEGRYVLQLVRLSDVTPTPPNPKYGKTELEMLCWFNFKIVQCLDAEADEENIGCELATRINVASFFGENSKFVQATRALVGLDPKDLDDKPLTSLLGNYCIGDASITYNDKGVPDKAWVARNSLKPLTPKLMLKYGKKGTEEATAEVTEKPAKTAKPAPADDDDF